MSNNMGMWHVTNDFLLDFKQYIIKIQSSEDGLIQQFSKQPKL